jgi:predicted membrane metal-binding protein
MKDISFAFSVYLLGFAVSAVIAALIKLILLMIRKFSRKEVNS